MKGDDPDPIVPLDTPRTARWAVNWYGRERFPARADRSVWKSNAIC